MYAYINEKKEIKVSNDDKRTSKLKPIFLKLNTYVEKIK